MSYNVLDFGAKGDGKTNDAAAIQAAIDTCSKAGGGRVVLKEGKHFYASSIILKENVDLHLEKGSFLQAHRELDTYFNPNEEAEDYDINKIEKEVVRKPPYVFLYAKDADHISITGDGTIDGNAFAFVKRVSRYYITGEIYPRPTLIYTEHCNHITFKDVTMQNAPFWTLHPAGCDDVLIQNIRILNSLEVANSDGIDPDHSTNVRILGCHITCGDDCICLKSTIGNMKYGPTDGVLISDCTLISTSAAIKIGTEGTGDFKNVLVQNCIISNSNRGISIQIRDEGNVENISFQNILISTRRFAECWWGCAEPIAISVTDRTKDTHAGKVSNIRFFNISCDSENGIFIHGASQNPVKNVTFEKIQVKLSAKSKWKRGQYDLRPGIGTGILDRKSPGFFLKNAENITLRDCSVSFCGENTGDFAEALYGENCRNICLDRFSGTASSEDFKDIDLSD